MLFGCPGSSQYFPVTLLLGHWVPFLGQSQMGRPPAYVSKNQRFTNTEDRSRHIITHWILIVWRETAIDNQFKMTSLLSDQSHHRIKQRDFSWWTRTQGLGCGFMRDQTLCSTKGGGGITQGVGGGVGTQWWNHQEPVTVKHEESWRQWTPHLLKVFGPEWFAWQTTERKSLDNEGKHVASDWLVRDGSAETTTQRTSCPQTPQNPERQVAGTQSLEQKSTFHRNQQDWPKYLG